MDCLSARDLRAVLTALEELAAATPLGDFPNAALAAVEQLVPCDHSGYNEIDLEHRQARGVINPPEAVFPGIEQVFVEHADENPLVAHLRRTGDLPAAKFSDFISQRRLHELPVYNLVYRRLSTEHQMAFEVSASPLVGIALNRSRLDFTERDRAVLDALRPHLRRAYLTAIVLGRLGDALDAERRATVVAGRDGTALAITPAAARLLAAYFAGERCGGQGLPERVARWLRHRQAFRAAEHDLPPPLEPLTVRREGASLVITFVPGGDIVAPDILFLEERPGPSVARPRFGRREREVLERLALGFTDKEIAEAMGVSPRTIQGHLQRIYRKLGVSNRTAALARIAAERGPRTGNIAG